MISLVNSVESNLQEGQLSLGYIKFPVHPHLLDVEAALSIVYIYLFDRFNHRFDVLVLVH